jgi:PAS domain S-box-containing protein
VSAERDLLAEVERLRAMLERQPSCLMRIAIGGTLLAVNQAAQSLLGARNLTDVLGTSIVERIVGDEPARTWDDFAARVTQSGSGSLECELQDPGGTRRAVVVQAVTLPTHPDGDESMLVTVKDVSTARRLEASLEERDELQRLRAASDAVAQERQELAAALAQLKTALSTAAEATLLAQQVLHKGGHR